jgi:hypothetical protein
MPITLEEMESWLDRHATVSARMLEVHKKWRGRRPLDPEKAAAFNRDYHAVLREFEQFKGMPEEVWDELCKDEPDTD